MSRCPIPAQLSTQETPYGAAMFVVHNKTLVALQYGENAYFQVYWDAIRLGYDPKPVENKATQAFAQELNEYFVGERCAFTFEPLMAGTAFYQRVYRELLKVPYGTVITYGALAERAGRPNAARAVGTAMAKNRVAIVIPCHRVIASNGGLGGYGGGLDVKKSLLDLEGWDGKNFAV